MDRYGDGCVQLAKRLGASDSEIDRVLAGNPALDLGDALDEAA